MKIVYLAKLEPWCAVDLKRRWVQKSHDHILGHLRHNVFEAINWQRPTPGNRTSRENRAFSARCLKEYHVGAPSDSHEPHSAQN